ncbi:ferredoxin reductase family protein [Celeribacter baekdonensis]|uniref:ferredoxin reductase family protein n=1 Tax=Celeribacter baekdonensis TaxID=875171 RepID=UPI0030D86D28|tara:strand:- start:1328 stop:2587 length:1260 start_codon:yes stop_codon:yes gene_type:complete
MFRQPGVAVLAATLIAFSILHVGFSDPQIPLKVLGATLLGGIAFILMATANLLAARPRWLEGAFGGLDRMYKVHKYAGTTAGVLALLHFPLSPDAVPEGVDAIHEALVPSAPLGMYAMIFLFLLLALTLNRKIAYHRWRIPHKAMGLVFALVFLHVLMAPVFFYDRYGPSGMILFAAGIIGLLSYLYTLLLMPTVTSRKYVVEAVNKLERSAEIVLAPTAGAMPFRAGQFAFVKFHHAGLSEPHPFTITSAPADAMLRFTVKSLGDWTRRIRKDLTPGTKVDVRGPYGRFDTSRGGDRQIWIAGGIGVAPFLSAVRSLASGDTREIWFFYAVREVADALYLEELRDRLAQMPRMRLILVESRAGDSCTMDLIRAEVDQPLAGYSLYQCGPASLTSDLSKGFRAAGVPGRRIHVEAFEFR